MAAGQEIWFHVVMCETGQHSVKSQHRTQTTDLMMLSLNLLTPHLLPYQLLHLKQQPVSKTSKSLDTVILLRNWTAACPRFVGKTLTSYLYNKLVKTKKYH